MSGIALCWWAVPTQSPRQRLRRVRCVDQTGLAEVTMIKAKTHYPVEWLRKTTKDGLVLERISTALDRARYLSILSLPLHSNADPMRPGIDNPR